jgi:putative ABC transport system ATP-binding protein
VTLPADASDVPGARNGLAVVACDLSKGYELGQQRIQALRGIDLSLPVGQFLSVMGPSGSGKSTLLHVVAGLIRPDEGRVSIGGTDLHALGDAEATRFRRRNLGLVFQFFNLVPTLRVEENIALPLLLDGRRLDEVRERTHEVASLLRLDRHLGRYPSDLSGGEMQRVAIARALLVRPQLLLADEPTGNLDSRSGEEVLSYLRRSSDEQGVTVMLVTHDPRASSYADRVLVLRDGEIADDLPAARVGRLP